MPPLTVNGVQAQVLDASSGILPGASAKTGPPAQAAMAAMARPAAHLAPRPSGPQDDFLSRAEIICFPICRADPIAALPGMSSREKRGRSSIRFNRSHQASFLAFDDPHGTPMLQSRRDAHSRVQRRDFSTVVSPGLVSGGYSASINRARLPRNVRRPELAQEKHARESKSERTRRR